MQGKGLIKFFTYVLLAVIIYQFSLIIPVRSVENAAQEYAEAEAAKFKDQPEKAKIEAELAKQRYLDSVSSAPVWNLLFKNYTYQELKRQQLAFGLDLQGGMSVVLQVDLRELIISLSGESADPNFREALNKAKQNMGGGQADFVQLFGQEYKKLAGENKLASLFTAGGKLDNININSTDAQVLTEIRAKSSEAVTVTYKRLKDRIDRFGVAQPTVSLDASTDRITVELPGVTNPSRAREYLQATANLEFWETYANTDVINDFVRLNEVLKKKKGKTEEPKTTTTTTTTPDSAKTDSAKVDTAKADTAKKDTGAATATTTPSTDTTATAAVDTADVGPLFTIMSLNQDGSAVVGLAIGRDTAAINAMISSEDGLRTLKRNARFMWDAKYVQGQNGERFFRLYAINTKGRREAPLRGESIERTGSDKNPQGAGYAVSLSMNEEGARVWKQMTTENLNRQVAIVLDNKIISAPRVTGVIPNGNTQITGDFTAVDANDLATLLSVGKLPAKTEIIEEAIVGPSLGQATITAGLFSLIIGLGLVLTFMFVYYSKAGLVSILMLLLNMIFIFGSLASFGTVLTLSGIAGIVLTIGMAVDANVIIYERIREQLRTGTQWKEAVVNGFKQSSSAILDSNITTFMTAVVLFYFGLGPIKGFATVLMIGVVSSVFTAVYVSQLFFSNAMEKDKEIAVGTAATMNVLANPSYDIIGKRKLAYMFSGLLIVAGIASMFVRGFELGVDLQGGRAYTVQFEQDVDVEAFKPKLQEAFGGYGKNVVKTFNDATQVRITTSYLQDNKDDKINPDEAVLKGVFEAAKAYSGKADMKYEDFVKGKPEGEAKGFYLNASSKVGATIADDIQQSAFLTSIIALTLIFVYILIRFRRWQFSAAAVGALAHDVLIILSIFSIFHGILPFSLEVDQAFIAALLTIIGYSINDTIIVFDRVRETLNEKKEAGNFASLINTAINGTLSRTSITSLTTWIVVVILFIFGGDGIRNFAFALSIGIFFGTYSSIFIAAPILVDTVKDADALVEEEEPVLELPVVEEGEEQTPQA